jgi:protein SCO1/2
MTWKKECPKGTLVLFISLITFLVITLLISPSTKKTIPKELMAVLRQQPRPIQPFTLIDKNEQAFTNKNLKGKWSFVFFGYTYCPDICPTTLFTLKQINNVLKKQPQTASDFQVVFVSIDPERDKPKKLAEYTEYFNKEFIAVTGLTDNLNRFTKQFSAAYIKEKTDASGNYLMGHTSSIFLVDPRMNIVASFSPPHSAETITSQYLKIHDMF